VPGQPIPAPGVNVRQARRDDADAAAGLVFDAAAPAYTMLAGSEARARQIVAELWAKPGHSASFEHALVAEIGGSVVGVMIGFPERDRYRLHAALLRAALRRLSPRRWPLLLAALPPLVLATPRPPRGAYYVGTIAVAKNARWRGVGSTLGHHAELRAADLGFPQVVAHTGTRHAVARRALENYGLRMAKARRNGYALYVKEVAPRA